MVSAGALAIALGIHGAFVLVLFGHERVLRFVRHHNGLGDSRRITLVSGVAIVALGVTFVSAVIPHVVVTIKVVDTVAKDAPIVCTPLAAFLHSAPEMLVRTELLQDDLAVNKRRVAVRQRAVVHVAALSFFSVPAGLAAIFRSNFGVAHARGVTGVPAASGAA
jgi:hypothetical protein